jgi:hypothetical protein
MKMGNGKGSVQNPAASLFERLLELYPPRFRREFSAELHSVLLKRLDEAGARGGIIFLASAMQEILALVVSILMEQWHERQTRKGEEMESEDQVSNHANGGGVVLQRAGVPSSGPRWVIEWIALTTAVYPLALFLASPLGILYLWLFNLGTKTGLWSAATTATLGMLGFFTGMALGTAAAQWLILRHSLPKPGLWFAATAAGIWLAGLGAWLCIQSGIASTLNSYWLIAALVLMTGLTLGLAQWLYARRYLRNAKRIIFIDLLAAASLLLLLRTFTNFSDLVWLIVLTFPGMITGVGMWLLLRQPESEVRLPAPAKAVQPRSWRKRMLWIGMVLAALIPLFFVSIYAYAAGNIALAKNQGVYPTVEAAVIGHSSRAWGDAQVTSVENIQTGPNYRDGNKPFLWFATYTVKYDRIPPGYDKDNVMGGNFFMHVRGGWVFMSEGSFPEFIAWVMELYHLEGVQ